MAIYSAVEYIRDFMNGTAHKELANTADDDARLLGAMCFDKMRLRASNGVTYFYCFLADDQNTDVAQYLLRRNGFLPRTHTSRYMGGAYRVVRVPESSFRTNASKKGFIQSVAGVQMNMDSIEHQLTCIRSEMIQNTK